jgi:hypothetical protein
MQNETEETQEELDFENPDFVFRAGETHDWRQQATYLVCKSCELQHAVYIGSGRVLAGLRDDGTPILMDREDYFKLGYRKAYEKAKG